MKDLLIPLLTVLASGLTAAVVTHILNSRREEHLFVRQKLEDIHLVLHRYTTVMVSRFMPFLRAMEGKLDYNQANGLLINGADKKDKDAFPTVERLIGIYFPDLEPDLMTLLTSRDKLNDIKYSYRQDYEKGHTSNGPWMEAFREELIRLGTLADNLKRKVVEHPIKTTQRMPTTRSSLSGLVAPQTER